MKNDLSQTSFQTQYPLYEQEVKLPQKENPEEIASKKPWFKRPRVILLAFGTLILLIILAVVFIPKNNRTPEPEVVVDLQENIPQDKNPFLDRIIRLEQDLKAADPTKPDLLFPPVDMAIDLEEN